MHSGIFEKFRNETIYGFGSISDQKSVWGRQCLQEKVLSRLCDRKTMTCGMGAGLAGFAERAAKTTKIDPVAIILGGTIQNGAGGGLQTNCEGMAVVTVAVQRWSCPYSGQLHDITSGPAWSPVAMLQQDHQPNRGWQWRSEL